MKKILLISFLTFFSISSLAETSLRCKYYKFCEDNSCTSSVQEAYKQLVYDESWLFGNKLFLQDVNYSVDAKYYDDYIEFGKISTIQHIFYKKSKILKTPFSFSSPQKSENQFVFGSPTYNKERYEYICTEIN
mgnify:CR=1 FL=1